MTASAHSPQPSDNAGIDAIVSSTRFQSAFTDDAHDSTIPIELIPNDDWSSYTSSLDQRVRSWLSTFPSPPTQPIGIPTSTGTLSHFVVPVKKASIPLWKMAAALSSLPPAKSYAIRRDDTHTDPATIELAWGLVSYTFTRYKKEDTTKPGRSTLVRQTTPGSVTRSDVNRALGATFMVRDMISTAAEDFGPADLEAAICALAAQHAATSTSIVADQLLSLGYPQVHRVGRAAAPDRAPRLLELVWGRTNAPKIALVGKGVCYDTGGLSIKPTSSMVTMKKDMGGAAQVLGLAHMIMDAKLDVSLRVLIPAVENSVGSNSYRPGDVLTSRSGKTTLNMNSDAEGRLVMADALEAATEEKPDLIVDCATLTGAQRIAMGPDIPSFFCTEDETGDKLFSMSKRVDDLMWPLPLYEPYRKMLDTPVADIKSCGSGPQGSAIAAALYLREFVGDGCWIHVDMMGYNNTASAGRPEGGEAMGMRALFDFIRERYAKEA